MIQYILLLLISSITPVARSSSLSLYNFLFEKVRRSLEKNQDDILVCNEFEQLFYRVYKIKMAEIVSSLLDINVSSEINTIANAYKFDNQQGTFAYGTTSQNKFVKILISGAKGKKNKETKSEISTLSLSEIVEDNQTANAIAYAARLSDTEFILDAKVNTAQGNAETNDKGQYVLCKSIGSRYVFNSLKTAMAITKMYRLVIGRDYIKFEINLLVAGAAVKDTSVVSKSSIKVVSYIASVTNLKVNKNMGLFTSDNVTNNQKSVSTHFGFLRVDTAQTQNTQKAASQAVVDTNNTNVNAYFLDFLNSINKK